MTGTSLDLRTAIASTPRLAGRRTVEPALPVEVAAPVGAQFGLDALVAIRESDQYDYAMLDGMVAQVLEPLVPAFPGLEVLVEHGANVMRSGAEGDDLRRHLRAQPLYADTRGRRPAAWSVQVGNVMVVYGLISAGKEAMAGKGSNAWVATLSRLVREHRPAALHTGPFSRLVRNKDLSSPLRAALIAVGTRVHCAENHQGMVVADSGGQMLWDVLAQGAHSDWQATLYRLQIGTLYELKNGRFPRGGDHPIPGVKQEYCGDGKRRVLAVDEDARAQVRAIIETAASGMSEHEAADILAGLGVRTRKPTGRTTHPKLVNEVHDVPSAVRRLWQHLPTYLDGTYVYHHRNTIAGLREMAGQRVHREHIDDLGEFRFTLRFPVPEGGWHDEELIRTAIAKRLTPRPKSSGTPSSDVKPLLRLGHRLADGREWRLLADDRDYILRARPIDTSGRGPVVRGFGTYEGELLARVKADELHREVARMLRAVVGGTPVATTCPGPVIGDQHRADLHARADALEAQAATARRLAAAPENAADSVDYQADARALASRARSLRQQAAGPDADDRLDTPGLTADTTQILAAAELLDRITAQAPVAVAVAVRTVISTLIIDATPGDPLARVTLEALVRTNRGHITVGPVHGIVHNSAGSRGRLRAATPETRALLLDRLLAGADDTDRLRETLGRTARNERRHQMAALTGLLGSDAARGVLLDCPIPAVSRIVLANLSATTNGETPSARDDDPWAAEIISTYCDPAWSWPSDTWARGNLNTKRETLAWIARNSSGDNGVRVDELRAKLHLTDVALYAMLNDTPGKYPRECLGAVPPLERTASWPTRRPMAPETRRVRLPMCPHCQRRTLPHLLTVPELPEGWICSQCRRPPGSNTVYPPDYLRDWVGPRQGQRTARTNPDDGARAPVGTHELPIAVPPRSGR
ncbi:hypothetical protein CWIS_04425 [Cellulomonas sp. A375-1]|uniref:hypothetical protein n=1 Tax=Cellulomonas sp. A375-1 TaxID=1672219 RepID=UPI0006527AD5|nr:hypothetical protein [Cellulomonas sp. A375-1]KMM46553.1 hypothetical protein CWIS_04425 [Cellulomonas sp. A375-1]